MLEKFKNRFFILSICFLTFNFVILYTLMDLQVIHGNEYLDKSQHSVLKETYIPAPRGRIMDRNGMPLALNRQGYNVEIVKTTATVQDFDGALLLLAGILEKNGEIYCNYPESLSKFLTIEPYSFNKSEKEIKKWQKTIFGFKEEAVFTDPVALFKYLRKDFFKISDVYDDKDAYRIMTLRHEILAHEWAFKNLTPLTIAEDVSNLTVAEVEEQHHRIPGITTVSVPIRRYLNADLAANVLGYVRGISSKQLEELKDKGYEVGDIVGQTGVEKSAEDWLRGKEGHVVLEVDTKGRTMEKVSGEPMEPGNDVILTLDLKLQQVALESFARNINLIKNMGGKKNFGDANAGAAVVIDIHTGEVLVMVSYPTFDPSIFLEGSDNKEAQKAIMDLFNNDNKDKPAFNRPLSGMYAPGSTFKPLIAIAALEEGIITPQTKIYDSGHVNIGNMDFWCLEYDKKTGYGAHGSLNVVTALAVSCNIFFHQIGYMTTIDKIEKWARYFGLGEYTGIDVDSSNEKRGVLATKEYKKETFNDIWRPADTAQVSIGQLYNAFTPLQLANYMSTLANGGKRYTPHLIKKVVSSEGDIVFETVPEYQEVPLKEETLTAVKSGMVAVTNSVDGTAVKVFNDFPFKVAGKTGTAETGYESIQSSNALFVAYAPADNPEIAIAVVVEKGVWGAYTAPIAKDIMEAYFRLKVDKDKGLISDLPALQK
ncbi:MAG: penicillin-binding protein 2 [Clostridiales bacterium]|nr:penicillin-binding protein 2 [Clostridiales bacterium]